MSNINGAQGGQVQWHQNPLHNPQPAQPAIAPRDVKASGGILSGAELVEKMGGAPKADVTFLGMTIRTNSEAYKGALGHLETYQEAVSALTGDVGQVSQQQVDGLKTNLRQVIAEADSYATKHAGSSGKADRRGIMAELKSMAQAELANLDKIGDLKNTAGKGITVADGLALVRGGITDASAFTKTLADTDIDQTRSKDNFASGKANSVSLIAYGADMRVVKSVSREADKLMAGESTTGFDQKDMRTAARNVATSNVASALGIGASLPKPDIVIHHGEAAIAMKLAPGESLIHKSQVPVTNAQDLARYDTEWNAGFVDNFKNYKVAKDDNGVWQKEQVGFKAIPYTGTSNPPLTASIQKGLLDLQTADCLMAQMDRQPENVFIRIVGDSAEITGIDNDMCMGKEMKHLDELDTGKPLRIDLKSTYGGPPPLMSRSMFDSLQALTVDAFKAALGPEFTPEEVAAATGRLALLKTHADDLETAGKVVDNFETWRGPHPVSGAQVNASDFLMASDMRSYVKRDATTLGKAAVPVALDAAKH